MTRSRLTTSIFIACLAAPLYAQTAADPNAQVPQLLRPSTLAERIQGLSFVALEVVERKNGTPAAKITLRFEPAGRSLFAEHIPLYLSDGTATANAPQRIQIEVGLSRKLIPVRFAAVGREGNTEAETLLLQSANDGEDEGGARGTAIAVCPPVAPAAKGTTMAEPPPLDRRFSILPGLLAHGQHAVDRATGAAIDVGGRLAPSLGIEFGWLWTKKFESVFEVHAGSYSLTPFANGTLLDKSITYWSFGAGARFYLSDSKGTYLETVLLYDRRFYIRPAGSGYFAASPFDFPELETRLGMMFIRPKRWGLFGQIAVHGIVGAWSSNLRPQIGYGADAKLQVVLRHTLAQLRFGPAFGYEKLNTDIVTLTNQRFRFELALDWEL